jgi:flagellar hook-basal body complex protein FliE
MSDLPIARVAEFAPAVWPTMPRTEPAAEGFSDTLGRLVRGVNALQNQAQQAAVALAAGEPVDMARALVTLEEANISLQLALQIRNKLVEAYQDVMRMPV